MLDTNWIPYAPIARLYPRERTLEMMHRILERCEEYKQRHIENNESWLAEESNNAIKHWQNEIAKLTL